MTLKRNRSSLFSALNTQHSVLWRYRDLLAAIALLLLWLLFFWRLFTPIREDQASLTGGDFSGQFVTFAGYQYARFAEGEIPLWNPYNNGGLPFIADTQAAVFYPPRLVTIALARMAGGWTYHALELEMTFHVLFVTLTMYLFARRLTGSVLGGFAAAIVAGYSGFLSGYPPLQLALLEAAVWLPLALLGVFEATRGDRLHPGWLALTGAALGLSWLAGHPQTSFFLTYLLVAYFGWGVYTRRWKWTVFVGGVTLFGALTFGLAAVQLLPGFEYLTQTTRAGFGYDAKSNGFPIQDVIQFIYPNVVSVFSPLYVGVTGLALALIALWRRVPGAVFWGVGALIALLWSFGGNSVVYPALYNILPGLRFFRGQERAAFLVVNSLAILAGMGAARLTAADPADGSAAPRLRSMLASAFRAALIVAALIVVAWLGMRDEYAPVIGVFVLSTVVIGALWLILPRALSGNRGWALVLIACALLAFELFTINMDADAVYDPIPPDQQISIEPPPLIAQVLADDDQPFRVDGFRGLTANYGSLYGVQDIRGISPLWLAGAYQIIEGDTPEEWAWELFAVRYVFSDWQELMIPTRIVGRGNDFYGAVNLHRLTDPRPFALLQFDAVTVTDDTGAYSLLADPGFNPRQTAIIEGNVEIGRSDNTPIPAQVTRFEPELIEIAADAPQPAILSIALPDYPGWEATIDGERVPIRRAYGALSAVAIAEGESLVRLVYNPLTYRVGALISLTAWIALGVFAVIAPARTQTRRAKRQD